MKLAPLFAVAVPSILLGCGLGWSLHTPRITIESEALPVYHADEPEPEFVEVSELSRVPLETRGEEAPTSNSPRTQLVDGGQVGDEEQDALFSNTLLAHAHREIVNGWHRERRDDPTEAEVGEGIDKFKQAALDLPHSLGIQLAKRRSDEELALEDARTGGVMMTLKRLDDGGEGPLMQLVRDRTTFDQFFQAEHSGQSLEGAAALSYENLRKNGPVKDGSVLTFPAGVFKIHDLGRYWRNHFPRDLTLRGSGKSSTLLVLQSDLSPSDTVRNLTLENCSIHTNNNNLFDLRSSSMSLTLRNLRITGWDNGAGGSSLFSTRGLALRAIRCDFLSGYGRSPVHSRLFDVRTNALLARFEDCTIARTEVFSGSRDGATLVFSGCRIEDARDRDTEVPAHVLLQGTTITWMSRTKRHEPPKLDLNDLFPGWKQALGQ